MTPSWKHFAIFVLAVVTANVITTLVHAAMYKSSPSLREHTPGF